MLHSKRSFGKYPRGVDSPAYDAYVSFLNVVLKLFDDGIRSEEDNDPLTDDGASAVSLAISANRPHVSGPSSIRSHLKPSTASRVKHQLGYSLLSDSDGVDSPTYDGDVESSATAGADTFLSSRALLYHHHSSSSTSTLSTPITPAFVPSSHATPINEQLSPMPPSRATQPDTNHPVFISPPVNPNVHHEEPPPSAAAVAAFNPAALTQEDIQLFVQKAIDGEPSRLYKINPPPSGRPVRVYADGLSRYFDLRYVPDKVNHMIGVYDLFHFG